MELMKQATASGTAAAASALGAALPDLASFAGWLRQSARLIRVETPVVSAGLVVETLRGREAVSEPFRFELDCLCGDAHLSLSSFIGQPLSVHLLLADGRSERSWHGLISRAAILGSDGGLARYRLVLEPWTVLLAQQRASRVFQHQDIEQIARQIFDQYPGVHYEFRLTQALAPRALCIQYRETDLAFISRLFASEGLSYVFEHEQAQGAGQASEQSADPQAGQYRLVIFDADTPATDCTQPLVRFHRSSATEAQDTVQHWQRAQQISSTGISRGQWQSAPVHTGLSHAPVDTSPWGHTATADLLEDYQLQAPDLDHASATHAQRSQLLAQWQALQAGAFELRGSVRAFAPASCFTLTGHSSHSSNLMSSAQPSDARQRLLWIEHEARNNYQANPGSQHSAESSNNSKLEAGSYRNRAGSLPASLPLVPPPPVEPRIHGPQSALIVSPQASASPTSTHSDRDAHQWIRFPWQDSQAPGIPVAHAETLAGPDWGSRFSPRVGSEVLIEFLHGRLDSPLIIAQLYNGQDAPPWPAGEGSQANHPGILAGIHAPTLDDSGWSQWQLDDSTGQLRTRLATSQHDSQLSLGWLIRQNPRSSQRGAWRGDGFELSSAAWQIQRAEHGLLLSTSARPQAQGQQLDTQEASAQLQATHDTAQRLSDAASQSGADPLAQASQIDSFRQIISAPHADANADAAAATSTPSTPGKPDDEVKPFTAPALLTETPSSLALGTPHSSTLFASEQLSNTVQGDTQLTAQHTASLISGEATSLYTHAGGIKAIAANAPLSIQAHDGPLEVLADQDVSVTSSNDEIHILASSKIVLQAGQSSITLEGGNITFACPGNFTAKGGAHQMAGGGSGAASLGKLPSGKANTVAVSTESPCLVPATTITWIETSLRGHLGAPMSGLEYKLEYPDGTVRRGVLDGSGMEREQGVPFGQAVLTYTNNPGAKDIPRPTLNDLLSHTLPMIDEERKKLVVPPRKDASQ